MKLVSAQQTKRALGSQAFLTLVGPTPTATARIFEDLWERIDAFEARFSRFVATSELVHVNAHAGQPTAVSPEFVRLMRRCLQLVQSTGGLFNPLILPKLQQAGYKGSWPHPAQFDPALDWSARRQASAQEIDLTATTILIPHDAAIDFGGIGKGYLLDELAAYLQDLPRVHAAWLSLGGDITAWGDDPATGQPWVVAVDPWLPGQPEPLPMSVPAGRLNVATSGVTRRSGQTATGSWHHIIDPRTGRPASTDVQTVTIAAPTATEADVLASCAVILGSQAAPDWLAAHGISTGDMRIQSQPTSIKTERTLA